MLGFYNHKAPKIKTLPFFILAVLTLGIFTIVKNTNQEQLKNSSAQIQTSSAIYWGAFIRGHAGNPTYPSDYGDVPWDMRTLDRFEANAGKRVSIVHFAQPWKNSSGSFMGFPANQMTALRNRGVIPMFNWGSWQLGDGANQPAFKLTKITRGDYDSYITEFARSVKNWGHPFFLRFNHEMNIGGQFSWNFKDTWTDPATGTAYRNTPDDFINMWRHVVDIFRREGATNVTWVWCPNIYFRSGSNALPFMQGYPGDSYVDWTCVDGYNKNSTSMTPFAELFTDSYKVLQQQVTGTDTRCSSLVTSCNPRTKPMMIGEWASVEAGDGGTRKASWIRDAFLTQLPNNFPGLKAVVWFNWNTANGLITESTQTALNTFKVAIGSSYYAANNFSAINTSPIRPPSAPPISPTIRATQTNSPTPPNNTRGDVNGDGSIDILDYQLLSNSFGKSPSQQGFDSRCDFNDDGSVDILDFQILSNSFGR